ncbi:hypothetical protein NX059_012224 [Plenodomus lindquistii]|nr:hypothetical protein NX059_012224 [Plenodomus lindquistii]
MSPDYSPRSDADEKCVFNVVEAFTARVAQHDRDCAYAEFAKPNSKIRMIFATSSLGMGMNFADVERVVTWRIPISKSLGDLWQRAGRGGRGPDRRSTVYIFSPYWLFSVHGRYRPGSGLGSGGSALPHAQSNVTTRPKRSKHQLPG